MVVVLLVLGCFLLLCLWGCIYFVWRLYLLGRSEHGIAVVDEIVKEKHYRGGRGPSHWVYTIYVHVTYHGEPFREKIRFSVRQRIVGFALGYEIPVSVSRSKRGKMRVFQKEKGDKVAFAILAVIYGGFALMLGLIIGLALSATLSQWT